MFCPASRKAKDRRGIFVVAPLLVVLAALGFSGFWLSGQTLATGEARDRHVLVISVDGLGANLYAQLARTVRVPNLQRLRAEGSYAEGVIGVYPSVTYPSHTTIVTGRMPAEHGIYSNLTSRQAGQNPHDWFWFSKAIKVPTLWDEARRNHLTTGSVFWPVTAGAPIEWDIPEIWDPQKGEVGDPLYVAKYATPGILFEALLEIGPPPPGTDDDITRTRLATFLLKKYKPNLLLVHLLSLDAVEHGHGPQSPEAAATLANEDKLVGDLLEALEESGLEKSTDVFIVSDHGFLTVLNEIAPNVLLAKAGLLATDEGGSVTAGKVATVSNGGSFFIYWPEGQDLRAEVDEALKPLRNQGVLWGIFNRSALRELGAEPAAQLALEAAEGWSFSSRARGAVVSKTKAPSGTHGYLPSRSGLEAFFVAWGPEIRAGVNLHCIRMTAIGPTILKVMGIQDPQFSDEPALADILK